ncbi:MAG: hypothetical protein ABSD97_13090 [Acidimicrobiales bacterium]|jgi:ElaB/YqjD/DUF883 family membrane-anchored ribosome-binding protein
MGEEILQSIRAELDTLAERLGDAAYESLRAQLHHGTKPAKNDPDLVREKLLSRARNAVERASSLVAKAERAAVGEGEDGLDEEDP